VAYRLSSVEPSSMGSPRLIVRRPMAPKWGQEWLWLLPQEPVQPFHPTRRLAGAGLCPVGTCGHPKASGDTHPAQWLGFPPPSLVADPWEVNAATRRPSDQFSDGVPGQFGGGYSVAHVAASPRHARGPVEATRWDPVAGQAHDATPPVGNRRFTQHREQLPQRGFDLVMHLVVNPGGRRDLRPELVGRSPSPHGDAAVGCALAVDDEIAAIAERGPAAQRDVGLLGVRQWFSGHHHRVQRDEGAAVAGQVPGVALGGPHHDVRPHRAPVGVQPG